MQKIREITMTELLWNELTFDIVAELICDIEPGVREYDYKGYAQVDTWNPKNVTVYDTIGNVIPLKIPESVINQQGNKWLDKHEEGIEAELWNEFGVYK